jgi:hypothetical protein
MSQLEHSIIEYLKSYHKGSGRAIHFKDLAEYFEINERELRNLIADLITDWQIPIGSSQSGYFFIDNDGDFTLAYAELISRIKKLARRAKGMRIGYMKSRQIEKPKQLVML